MVTHLAVCGDSFGVGAGLPDDRCFEDSFGGVVAEHFKLPLKVYARSGCCNFTIYLQVKKIIDQVIRSGGTYKPFVLITSTYHERLIFPLDDGTKYTTPDLRDVEYMSYIPYHNNKVNDVFRELEFHASSSPRLITETISNITHYQQGKAPGIARLFEKVNRHKFEAIAGYYTELYDSGIKRDYDEALYASIQYQLKKHNIPFLVTGFFHNTFDGDPNFMRNEWGYYTQRYPDTQGSGHCNEEGNRLVGESMIAHITRHNLL